MKIEPMHHASEGSMKVGINGVAMLSPLTGIGQYTFHLVQQLQQLQLSPWLFYGTDWRQELREGALPGMTSAKKAFKRLIPNPYVVQRFLLQRMFSRGVRQHGITLYHEPNFMSYRFSGPTVVTVHDLAWVRYPETQPPALVREMHRLMPATLKTAAHIVVVSDFVRREMIEYFGLAGDRITTVLHGVAPEFMPQDASRCAAVMARYGLQHGSYVLAVATLEPRKNLVTLIAAFAQLPTAIRQRCPLVIVGMRGWGESLMSAGLQKMIASGEVRLTGYVPQADLPGLYAGARVFVYPSLYEGFGLPPLEAMACGVPAIVSNRASLPEVVGKAGILTEALDDAGLARHMQTVIEDEGLHAHLSQAGCARSQEFTWRKCALETIDVYKMAVDNL